MISRTTVDFSSPFHLPGFDESLPAGVYDIETEASVPPDHRHPEKWKASVVVHLHARSSHPGLARNLTVSLAELEDALTRDKKSGRELTQHFLDQMLSDPMVRMVMQADGVSEAQVRNLYASSNVEPAAAEPELQEGNDLAGAEGARENLVGDGKERSGSAGEPRFD